MNNYATLFDKNYLSRGLMLLESLKERCKEPFTLYILAIDDEVYHYFYDKKLPNVECFSVNDLSEMYPILIKLRKERTNGEFCWTLSSFLIQYVFNKYRVENCTYLDSDIFFLNDPQILIDEMGDKSVLITEHNYTSEYDVSELSGVFCVQFMCFKNNKSGNEVLEWWRNSCEQWCFNRLEDGKFGDQKYLDDWESRFGETIYNCRRIGCGLAPWNCKKYELSLLNGHWYVTDRIRKTQDILVFYHFHNLFKLERNRWSLSGYEIPDDIRQIYYLYIKGLIDIERTLPNELKSKTTTFNKISEKKIVLRSVYRGLINILYWYNRFKLPQKNVVKENDIECNI